LGDRRKIIYFAGKINDLETDLLQFILPEELLEYFTLTDAQKTSDSYTFYLSEKNICPQEYTGQKLQSKGFFDEETVRDFPLRGKACYLKIKRRKWLNEDTGKVVYRNWELVANGTRMTKEFATFLKGILR
jgi:hypothetical protein